MPSARAESQGESVLAGFLRRDQKLVRMSAGAKMDSTTSKRINSRQTIAMPIAARRPFGIHCPQDVGELDLVRRSLALIRELRWPRALLLSLAHHVFLVHKRIP